MRLYLLIGGNSGDRYGLIQKAAQLIGSELGEIAALSSIYETEPWGFEAEVGFLNQAVVVDSEFSLDEALRRCHSIEHALGRVRNSESQYTSRTMDVDIIFADQQVVQNESIVVPHPRMHLRRFVLVPLAEVAAEMVHPILQKSVQNLLADCPDSGAVTLWKS